MGIFDTNRQRQRLIVETRIIERQIEWLSRRGCKWGDDDGQRMRELTSRWLANLYTLELDAIVREQRGTRYRDSA